MYEIRNENEVWYKSGQMKEWVLYGKTPIITEISEEEYEKSIFDTEKEKYITERITKEQLDTAETRDKILAIPQWLNEAAEEKGLDLSLVFQKALKEVLEQK